MRSNGNQDKRIFRKETIYIYIYIYIYIHIYNIYI